MTSKRDNKKNQADWFANNKFQLLVAATHGVFVLSDDGLVKLFSSGSKGIAAATRTRQDSDVIAVADSQTVVLHHVAEGMNRTYRLKESGPPRQLWYDKKHDRLLYATALEPAVQVYSLKTQQLVEPATSHPSPPTLFTVHTSTQLNLLLSASAKPPTIYITTLGGNTHRARCLVQPPCTESACSAAAFHPAAGPTPGTIMFVLGFLDGTVAAYSYDASRLEDRSKVWEELASVPGTHTSTTDKSPPKSRLRSPSGKGSKTLRPANKAVEVGDLATAVTAVALVSGHICLAVSIGSDGTCCVTDFAAKKGPEILHSWNLHGGATALAIQNKTIAIGANIGRVSLFSLQGDLLFTESFDGHKIVDLEWINCTEHSAGETAGKTRSFTTTKLAKKSSPSASDAIATFAFETSSQMTPKGFEKSPSFLSGFENEKNRRRTNDLKELNLSPSSNRRSRTNLNAHPSRQKDELRLSMKSPTERLGQASKAPHGRASSVSSSGTVRQVTLASPQPRTASKVSNLPRVVKDSSSGNTQRGKQSTTSGRIELPKVPPRPARSPPKPSKGQRRPSVLSSVLVQPGSRQSRPVTAHALDGSKETSTKRAGTAQDHRKKSDIKSDGRSTSSSVYSDDYVLEWSYSASGQNDSRGKHAENTPSLPFRQPADALQPSWVQDIGRKDVEPRQPVLKAPFPEARRQSLPAEDDVPYTPQFATFKETQSPSAVSATKQHSEAKRVRRTSLNRPKGFPTPTRRPRKDRSVEIELLDKTPRPDHVPIPTPTASSGTSSYMTAFTQTDISIEASVRGGVPRTTAEAIRDQTADLRRRVGLILREYEEAVEGLLGAVENQNQIR